MRGKNIIQFTHQLNETPRKVENESCERGAIVRCTCVRRKIRCRLRKPPIEWKWTEMRTANRAAMRYLQCRSGRWRRSRWATSNSSKSLVAVPCFSARGRRSRNRKAVTRPTDLLKVHPPFLVYELVERVRSQTHRILAFPKVRAGRPSLQSPKRRSPTRPKSDFKTGNSPPIAKCALRWIAQT